MSWWTEVLLALIAVVCVKCQDLPIQYGISEETEVTKLGNVIRDSFVLSKYNKNSTDGFQCVFTNAVDLFTLSDSCDLSTTQPINREAICPQQVLCNVILDIQVMPIEFFEILKVNVTVSDINDEQPTFPQQIKHWTVSESSAMGSFIPFPRAVDRDSPLNGIKEYKISPENVAFEIVDDTDSVEAVEDLYVKIIRDLDRELESNIVLTIIAYDGGYPVQSGSILLNITITDSNDNAPLFSQPGYTVQVPENTSQGTKILTISASDPDIGLAGVINFSLSVKSKEAFGEIFQMETSGELSVIGELDYEEEVSYQLNVVAQNMDGSGMASQTQVTVDIGDINDNKPRIFLSGSSTESPLKYEMNEEEPIGSFVLHFSADDLDSGNNGLINCTTKSPGFEVKQMYPTEFKIVNTVLHDREITPTKGLLISCNDHGDPQLSSNQYIIITFIDINDNAPLFESSFLHGHALTNEAIGEHVATVRATDKDTGDNGLFTYSIQPPLDSFFAIDTLDGNISTIATVPEALHHYNLTALAIDRGTPTQTGSAQIQINIEGAQSNHGQQSEKGYHQCIVIENTAVNSEVCSLAGSLAVPNLYRTLMTIGYAVSYNMPEGLPFTVDETTGKISTTDVIDRELVNSFSFNVSMTLSYRNSEVKWNLRVAILVEDENDNTPKFTFPTSLNNTVSISNRMQIGDVVARVQAIDSDLGPNSDLTFSMERQGMFRINSMSGEVYLLKNLTNTPSFSVSVVVSDAGKPARRARGLLRINLPTVQATTDEEEPWDEKLITLIVIAVACAIVFVCLVLLCVACVWCHRKKDKERRRKKAKEESEKRRDEAAAMRPEAVPDLVWLTGNRQRASLNSDVSSQMTADSYIASASVSRGPSMTGQCPSHHHRIPSKTGDDGSVNSSSFDVQSSASTYDSGRGSSMEHFHARRPSEGQEYGLPLTLWNNPIPEDDHQNGDLRCTQVSRAPRGRPTSHLTHSHYDSDSGIHRSLRQSQLVRSSSVATPHSYLPSRLCSDTYIRRPKRGGSRPSSTYSDSELYEDALKRVHLEQKQRQFEKQPQTPHTNSAYEADLDSDTAGVTSSDESDQIRSQNQRNSKKSSDGTLESIV